MTEADWDFVLCINNDPEIGYFTEGDEWQSYTLEGVQRIYRSISRAAYMFIIEVNGRAIGECWLQEMNLPRLREQYPALDLRRIDLANADSSQWGHGLGTRTIQLLVQFGFEQEGAYAIFVCDVWDYNHHSRRASERAGFKVVNINPCPPGAKGQSTYDLALFRPDVTMVRPTEATAPAGTEDSDLRPLNERDDLADWEVIADSATHGPMRLRYCVDLGPEEAQFVARASQFEEIDFLAMAKQALLERARVTPDKNNASDR